MTDSPTSPDSGADAPNQPHQPLQTRGQNPDRAHEGALKADAATTTPDDATQRGGYAGSAQGEYDNRDGAPRREGGGQSDPAPTNASNEPGDQPGYTNQAAREGSAAQGTGSRGGSYNDQNANAPHAAGTGRTATDAASTTGAASGAVNTGPRQAQAEQQAEGRPASKSVDSGGASTGRAPEHLADHDASERV